MPAEPNHISVRGKTYRSQQAAADDLNLTRQAIYMAKVQGRLNSVGLNPKGKNHGRRIVIGDKTYESIADYARESDMNYHTAREYFR